MTRDIKTRAVEKGLNVNFIKKAEENLKSAVKNIENGSYNASAVNAVHSAISAVDAYCVFSIGKRCASENHKDTEYLIMETNFPKETSGVIVKLFVAVIIIKNMAEYEELLVRQKEAEKAVREAQELLNAVNEALRK